MKKPLYTMKKGEKGRIFQIEGEAVYQLRLKDYGIVEGTCVRCRHIGPGNHLYAIEARGTLVAIRKKDAGMILVEA